MIKVALSSILLIYETGVHRTSLRTAVENAGLKKIADQISGLEKRQDRAKSRRVGRRISPDADVFPATYKADRGLSYGCARRYIEDESVTNLQ